MEILEKRWINYFGQLGLCCTKVLSYLSQIMPRNCLVTNGDLEEEGHMGPV